MNIDYEFNTVDGVHFQKEEISQIEKGFAHGLTEEQVKIYANPYFSDLDMKLIRKGIEHNFTDEEIKLISSRSDLYLRKKEVYKAISHRVCPEGIRLIAEGPFDGSWNYPTLFDLSEREAIKEYNKMWDQVANWP